MTGMMGIISSTGSLETPPTRSETHVEYGQIIESAIFMSSKKLESQDKQDGPATYQVPILND